MCVFFRFMRLVIPNLLCHWSATYLLLWLRIWNCSLSPLNLIDTCETTEKVFYNLQGSPGALPTHQMSLRSVIHPAMVSHVSIRFNGDKEQFIYLCRFDTFERSNAAQSTASSHATGASRGDYKEGGRGLEPIPPALVSSNRELMPFLLLNDTT